MKITKKTHSKSFLAAIFAISALIGITLPAYADITKVSLKLGSVKSLQKDINKIKCRRKRIKGRNSHINRKLINCNSAPRKFSNPRIGGLRIDACVYGAGWNKSDTKRCDSQRLKRIANEFCKSKGFNKSSDHTKVSQKGRHAVLTYKINKPDHSFWKRKKGDSLVKNIICIR